MRVLLTIIVGVVIGLWWRVKNRDPNVEPAVRRDRPAVTSHDEAAAPAFRIYAGSAVDANAASMVELRYGQWSADPSPARLALARQAFTAATIDQMQRKGVAADALGDLASMSSSGTVSQAMFGPLSDRIASLADQNQVLSTVSVTTRVPGALVWYQTEGQRIRREKPRTLPSATDCTTKLPVGEYYMWATRGGVATSSPNRPIPILGERVPVELIEEK